MTRLLALVALLACGDNIDSQGQSHGLDDLLTEWLTDTGATHGTVFRCESGAACLTPDGEPATEEWCWAGDELELEAHLGVDAFGCWAIGADERWWPWLVGCAHKCDVEPGESFKGCNSHCGCACEAP